MLNALYEQNPKFLIEQAQIHHINTLESEALYGKGGCSLHALASGISYLTQRPATEEMERLLKIVEIPIEDTPMFALLSENPDLPAILSYDESGKLYGLDPKWLVGEPSQILLDWMNKQFGEKANFEVSILPPAPNATEFIRQVREIDTPMELVLKLIHADNSTSYHSVLASPLMNSRFRMVHDGNFEKPFPVLLKDLENIMTTYWSYYEDSKDKAILLYDEPRFLIKRK